MSDLESPLAHVLQTVLRNFRRRSHRWSVGTRSKTTGNQRPISRVFEPELAIPYLHQGVPPASIAHAEVAVWKTPHAYRHLSLEEIKPLLPAIHEAIV